MSRTLKTNTSTLEARSLVRDLSVPVFQLSCEVYSWIRSILALTGLIFLAVTFLAPSFSLYFGISRPTPTVGQPMSCSAVEGMRSTWVCASLVRETQESSRGGTLLTQ